MDYILRGCVFVMILLSCSLEFSFTSTNNINCYTSSQTSVNATTVGSRSVVLDWTVLFSPEDDTFIAEGRDHDALSTASTGDEDENRDNESGMRDTYEAYLDLAYTKTEDEESFDQAEENNEPELDATEEIDSSQIFHETPSQTCIVQLLEPRKGWVTVYNGSGKFCNVSQLLSDQDNLFRLQICKDGQVSAWIYLEVNTSEEPVACAADVSEATVRGNASDVTNVISRLQKTSQIDRLDACASPKGQTPLVGCAFHGAKESLSLLLEGGAGPHVLTSGPLIAPIHGAAWRGYLSFIKRLESTGASWDDCDRNGYCGLEYAIWGCQKEVAIEAVQDEDHLRKRQSEQPILSVAITSLFYYGVKSGQKKTFIKRSHNIDHRNKTFEEILKILLEGGAQVNDVDENGNTPLHTAAMLELPAIFRMLVFYGGDVTLPNRLGHTPSYLMELMNFQYVEMSSEKPDKFYSLTKKKLLKIKT